MQSAPVCTVEVTVMDLNSGESRVLGNANVFITGSNITFTVDQLPTKSHFIITAVAVNIQGSVTYSTLISKLIGCGHMVSTQLSTSILL